MGDLGGDLGTAGVTVAIVLAAAAWVRWATIPVIIAFRAGRLFERVKTRERQEAARGRITLRAR